MIFTGLFDEYSVFVALLMEDVRATLPLPQPSQGELSSCQITAADSCQTIPSALSYLSTFFNAMLIIVASKCLESFPLLQRKKYIYGCVSGKLALVLVIQSVRVNADDKG